MVQLISFPRHGEHIFPQIVKMHKQTQMKKGISVFWVSIKECSAFGSPAYLLQWSSLFLLQQEFVQCKGNIPPVFVSELDIVCLSLPSAEP